MINVYYIHSKICEAIAFGGNLHPEINVDAVIYGRNYKGPAVSRSITFYEDRISDDMALLTYGRLISLYFSEFKDDDIRVIIPHFYNPLFILLASHSRVKEVYYIEEGDLSYSEFQNPDRGYNILEYNKCSDSIGKILSDLGFFLPGDGYYPKHCDNWFADALGKYSGTIVSVDQALLNFNIRRYVVPLNSMNLFSDSSVLVLLPSVKDLIEKFHGNLDSENIYIDKKRLQVELLRVIGEVYKSVCTQFVKAEYICYCKPHPSLSFFDMESIVGYFTDGVTLWADTDFDCKTRGVDISYLNYDFLVCIGDSSAVRYAINAGRSMDSIKLFNNNILFKMVLEGILEKI